MTILPSFSSCPPSNPLYHKAFNGEESELKRDQKSLHLMAALHNRVLVARRERYTVMIYGEEYGMTHKGINETSWIRASSSDPNLILPRSLNDSTVTRTAFFLPRMVPFLDCSLSLGRTASRAHERRGEMKKLSETDMENEEREREREREREILRDGWQDLHKIMRTDL